MPGEEGNKTPQVTSPEVETVAKRIPVKPEMKPSWLPTRWGIIGRAARKIFGGNSPSVDSEQLVKDTLGQNPITAEAAEQAKADILKAPPSESLTPREASLPPQAQQIPKEELDGTNKEDDKIAKDLRNKV